MAGKRNGSMSQNKKLMDTCTTELKFSF